MSDLKLHHCGDRRLPAHFTAPSRTFWIILSVALFFAVVGISVVGVLSFSPSSAQAGSQLVRLTLQGQQDPLRNQTALVDKSRSTVTYYITSQTNRTAVVLYDSRNGYVCYKPAEQHACYLRRMDAWDLQTLQTSLNASEQRADQLLHQNNQTKYYREFLGILAGEQVDPKSLGEAVQALCEQTSIFWVRRGEALVHTGSFPHPAGNCGAGWDRLRTPFPGQHSLTARRNHNTEQSPATLSA
ncbi:PREDICTED: BRICHOS domain-containing protein 5 [Charadrius vociferus]|uniref:BRICHOS domain-containing protein 5 n=1 Tax=Charadrius vociferus TaxID=50402 RepID=UPI000521939D|nr:PREDICTED: BRICHOS domain-containing protein 5 [Charadrius vociferus]